MPLCGRKDSYMFRYLLEYGPDSIKSYAIGLLLSLPLIVLALSVHESAHAWVAYKLGDPTAYNLGRVTLNPIKHLNLPGFLCMLFFGFGWATPVPIMSRNFKKPRRDMALSAVAGPISNLLLGFIFSFLTVLSNYLWRFLPADISDKALTAILVWVYFLQLGALLNVSLAVFNLLPVPPLDGSRFFYIFLPTKWYFGVMKYEKYIEIAIFALLWLGVLDVPLSFLTNAILTGMYRLWELIPIFA